MYNEKQKIVFVISSETRNLSKFLLLTFSFLLDFVIASEFMSEAISDFK